LTSHKIARDYLSKVEARLEALHLFLARGRFDDVMREAAEAVELVLKGALRFVGVDPPKRHEPASALLRHLDRLPEEWRLRSEAIRDLSGRLFEERGAAFYGDEDDLLPPSELFDRSEAEEAIRAVTWLVEMYRRLVNASTTAADG
jgi:HEPN domain-containing protein